MNPALFRLPPSEALTRIDGHIAAREMHFTQINGKPYYLAFQDDDHTRLLRADSDSAAAFETFDEKPFIKKVKAMNPGMAVIENVVLKDYDEYYYSKHNEKRLPVLRVKINTPQQTWYYVDLKAGQVVLKHEKLSRLERWLYHGLHSFDFQWLLYKRPLWDITVILLMIGGMSASCTGLVLTWKWIKRKSKPKTKPKARELARG